MTKLEQVAEILKDAREDIEAILEGEPQTTTIFVTTSIQKIENRLSRITGSSPNASDRPAFESVTRFMGEDIKARKPLTDEDLNPTKSERDLLSDKVDKLFAIIQTMDPADLAETYGNAADEIVLRGVAKRAGIPDYETEKITESFVEDIIEAIRAADAHTQEEIDIEEELKKQDAMFNNGGEDPLGEDGEGEDPAEPDVNPDAHTQEEIDNALSEASEKFKEVKEVKKAATKAKK